MLITTIQTLYCSRIHAGINHTFLLAVICPLLASSASADPDPTPAINTLDNLQLIARAEELRSNILSMEQRTLNHQWLDDHEKEDAVVDGKAFSELSKRVFDDYIDRKRDYYFGNKPYIPDSSGKARFKALDYDVNLSSNQVGVGFNYRF